MPSEIPIHSGCVRRRKIHEKIVAELKAMYDAEREVAVYPCLRGVAGRANADGVLQPWLSPHDLCEP